MPEQVTDLFTEYADAYARGEHPRAEEYLARAGGQADELARLLKEADTEKVLKVLGPAPAPLARLKGEHRMQVLIKTRYRRQAREALDAAMAELKEIGQDLKMITVEVDPVNLM